MIAVWIVVAGGAGAVARALVDDAVAPRPAWLGTLGTNVTGCLLIGLCAALPAEAHAVVATGFLGGFTTFSTASWQAARALGRRRPVLAMGYLAATVAGCLAAALIGRAVGSALL